MAEQVIIYWLIAQLLGLAGLPLARSWFRALPDRGYSFAKPLGLLLTGYIAWLLAMLGLAAFGAPLLVASALGVLGFGLLMRRAVAGEASEQTLGFRAAPLRYGSASWSAPVAWLRDGWRMVLGYEALFALALLFVVLLRSHDLGFVGPNPWGTERPMDYALFNAIRQSERFPPHDPWLAGYSINYYYFGYLLMAAIATLSGLSPAVAYNLSLALIFALTALGAAGVVYNLVGLTNVEVRTLNAERAVAEPERSAFSVQRSAFGRWAAMLLAVVLVLFAANQGGALQVITGSEMAVALPTGDLGRAILNGLGAREPLQLATPFRGEYFDGTTEIVPGDQAQNFNWWNSSRALWDAIGAPNPETEQIEPYRRYAITEFPFFSFWLGDMHPHVMALPFGLLAMALALNTLARPELPAFGTTRRGWFELIATGVVLGSLYVINSWDLPTYLLLFAAVLALRFHRRTTNDERRTTNDERRTTNDDQTALTEQEDAVAPTGTPSSLVLGLSSTVFPWRAYARQLVPVLVAAFVLFAPFHLTFRSLVGGKEPLIDVPLLGGLTRTIGFVTWGRTELHQFLIIFGLFLVPLVAYVFVQVRRARERATDSEDMLPRWWPWALLGTLVVGTIFGFPLLALLPLGFGAAWLAFAHADEPATAFTLGVFALGCAIGLGTELVYVRDVFEGLNPRLNSIFKFYYQLWLLWAVAAAYAVWFLLSKRVLWGDGTRGHEDTKTPSLRVFVSSCLRVLVAGLWVLLLAGALVYSWLTLGQAFRDGQQVGLSGVTPRERTPEGVASIEWLRRNVPGDAVILEAVGPAYDTGSLGFGQVSAATGLATVIGWEGHQQQWRGGMPEVLAVVGQRAADVAMIYSTPDVAQARELLRQYDVNYIYVGVAERTSYPPEGLDKLAQLGEPVFQQGEVTIYKVFP
jgi:YYY domain-containing protein